MQSYNCPRCRGTLTFEPLYLRWYCYTCGTYPFEENVSYTHQGQTQCPVCGHFLTYVESYKAWFCYHCQKYSAVSDPQHSMARCPTCSSQLTYNAQNAKWYCYTCQKYIGMERLDQTIEQEDKKTKGTVIEDIFLLYNDGRLIRHSTRRLKPTVDSDILSSMLVAVQEFVKDALKTEEGEGLDEIKVGGMTIHLIHGKFISIALLVQGDDVEGAISKVRSVLDDVEAKHEAILCKWDVKLSNLSPVIKHIEALFA
jgi:ribosomal protein L37AE/L43A